MLFDAFFASRTVAWLVVGGVVVLLVVVAVAIQCCQRRRRGHAPVDGDARWPYADVEERAVLLRHDDGKDSSTTAQLVLHSRYMHGHIRFRYVRALEARGTSAARCLLHVENDRRRRMAAIASLFYYDWKRDASPSVQCKPRMHLLDVYKKVVLLTKRLPPHAVSQTIASRERQLLETLRELLRHCHNAGQSGLFAGDSKCVDYRQIQPLLDVDILGGSGDTLISVYEQRHGDERTLFDVLRKCRFPLGERRIGVYGRQILSGLNHFLNNRVPYFHLCSENVIVGRRGDFVSLAGYEYSVLGLGFRGQTELVPSLMRGRDRASVSMLSRNNSSQTIASTSTAGSTNNHGTVVDKCCTDDDLDNAFLWTIAEQVMVVHFGHLLLEMVTGRRNHDSGAWLTQIEGADVPSGVCDVLESIFGRMPVVTSATAMAVGHSAVSRHTHRLPTIADLRRMSLFLEDGAPEVTGSPSTTTMLHLSDDARAICDCALRACLMLPAK